MALTLKMTTAQVVEASALSGTVNISHIQDYVHPVDDAQLTSFYLSLMFASKKPHSQNIGMAFTLTYQKLLTHLSVIARCINIICELYCKLYSF